MTVTCEALEMRVALKSVKWWMLAWWLVARHIEWFIWLEKLHKQSIHNKSVALHCSYLLFSKSLSRLDPAVPSSLWSFESSVCLSWLLQGYLLFWRSILLPYAGCYFINTYEVPFSVSLSALGLEVVRHMHTTFYITFFFTQFSHIGTTISSAQMVEKHFFRAEIIALSRFGTFWFQSVLADERWTATFFW